MKYFLREIQKDIQTAILKGNFSTEKRIIKNQPPLSPEKRLEIYVDAYVMRLQEVIDEDFVYTKDLLGAEVFENIVFEYIRKFYSKKNNISEYSQFFPEFILNHTISINYPWLKELPQIEWSIVKSFLSTVENEMSIFSLQNCSEGKLMNAQFKLASSVFLHKCNWNFVDFIYQIKKEIFPKQSYVLIYRKNQNKDFIVKVEEISELEFFVIQKLKEGLSLIELCSEIELIFTDFDIENALMKCFQKCLHNGLIIDSTAFSM